MPQCPRVAVAALGGAAPIQRAIAAGDKGTGITIMQMDEGLDTGPILMQQALPIHPSTTGASLTDELATLGGGMIIAALDKLTAGPVAPRPQPPVGVTYARKLTRDEARLDWRLPAAQLERQVRAFDPGPGAWLMAAGGRIRVLAATVEARPPSAIPGTVLDDCLAIACGEGVLCPTRLQRPGRAALDTAAFLRGFAVPAGTVLPCPATS